MLPLAAYSYTFPLDATGKRKHYSLHWFLLCLYSAFFFTFIQPLCYFTLGEGKLHFVNNFEKCCLFWRRHRNLLYSFTYRKIYEIQ